MLRIDMVKANDTIFQFYLAMMDYFGKFLSEKYPNSSSIEDTKHYQTVIITKIVQMFHSLELLTKNTLDEVSARCILRGILDSVTTYGFIYQRSDKEEILFRHHLYALDGWRVLKKSVIPISEDNEYKYKEDYDCDYVIKQIEEKLREHSYYAECSTTVESLIQNANWKYESLQNPRSLKYWEMYALVGFNSSLIEYFKGYLSQFAHGLCFSNKQTSPEILKSVLYESIILADKLIQTVCQTFNEQEMLKQLRNSNNIQSFLNSKDFNLDELSEFVIALVRKDKTILI